MLGPEFFDAERHPVIAFRSTAVRLADDGRAEADGELTFRGVTRPVAAGGHYAPPRLSSFGDVAGLQLRTSFDRREFGFEWQMELPGGGDAEELARRAWGRGAAWRGRQAVCRA